MSRRSPPIHGPGRRLNCKRVHAVRNREGFPAPDNGSVGWNQSETAPRRLRSLDAFHARDETTERRSDARPRATPGRGGGGNRPARDAVSTRRNRHRRAVARCPGVELGNGRRDPGRRPHAGRCPAGRGRVQRRHERLHVMPQSGGAGRRRRARAHDGGQVPHARGNRGVGLLAGPIREARIPCVCVCAVRRPRAAGDRERTDTGGRGRGRCHRDEPPHPARRHRRADRDRLAHAGQRVHVVARCRPP